MTADAAAGAPDESGAEAGSRATEEPATRKRKLKPTAGLMDWGGKLLLVGATALAGYYLGPYLTNKWQSHQDTLARKQALVDRISQASGNFLGVVQLQAERKRRSSRLLDAAYVRWQIESEEIHTQIAAIEHRGQVTAQEEWSNYASDLTWVYYLFRPNTSEGGHALHEVAVYLNRYVYDCKAHGKPRCPAHHKPQKVLWTPNVLLQSPLTKGKINTAFDNAMRSLLAQLRFRQRQVILAIKPQSA